MSARQKLWHGQRRPRTQRPPVQPRRSEIRSVALQRCPCPRAPSRGGCVLSLNLAPLPGRGRLRKMNGRTTILLRWDTPTWAALEGDAWNFRSGKQNWGTQRLQSTLPMPQGRGGCCGSPDTQCGWCLENWGRMPPLLAAARCRTPKRRGGFAGVQVPSELSGPHSKKARRLSLAPFAFRLAVRGGSRLPHFKRGAAARPVHTQRLRHFRKASSASTSSTWPTAGVM